MTEAARAARARGDDDEAIRLAAELRRRFPDNLAGYQIGSIAARQMRRYNEAAAIVADGAARFPAQAWLAAEAARIAKARGDLPKANGRPIGPRGLFPDDPADYSIASSAAPEVGRPGPRERPPAIGSE
ncbi:MAG: hypothetical protein ACLQE9_07010 [Roseiarcus sp.]